MNAWQLALLCVAAWFSLCACALCGWILLVELGRRSRARRRGGLLKPPASPVLNRVTSYTTGATHTTGVYFSSPGEPGEGSAGVAIRPTPVRPNRPGGRTWSGNATADPGANGQPLEAVDSRDNAAGVYIDERGHKRFPDGTQFVEQWSVRVPEPRTWDATYPPWPHA